MEREKKNKEEKRKFRVLIWEAGGRHVDCDFSLSRSFLPFAVTRSVLSTSTNRIADFFDDFARRKQLLKKQISSLYLHLLCYSSSFFCFSNGDFPQRFLASSAHLANSTRNVLKSGFLFSTDRLQGREGRGRDRPPLIAFLSLACARFAGDNIFNFLARKQRPESSLTIVSNFRHFWIAKVSDKLFDYLFNWFHFCVTAVGVKNP